MPCRRYKADLSNIRVSRPNKAELALKPPSWSGHGRDKSRRGFSFVELVCLTHARVSPAWTNRMPIRHTGASHDRPRAHRSWSRVLIGLSGFSSQRCRPETLTGELRAARVQTTLMVRVDVTSCR
jgi:hypothetical protein